MTPKLKKIITGLIVAIIVFVAYAILKPDPTNEVLVGNREGGIVGAVSNQQARVLGAQISQALLKIDQIKLDRSVFENPIFKSLKDRSQNIEPEPIGRTNPFAPLGDTTVNSALRTAPGITSPTLTTVNATSTAGVVVEENQ